MIRSLVIPGRPVSVNHMYRQGTNRNGKPARFLTNAGVLFKKRVADAYLKQHGKKEPTDQPCLVMVVYTWKDRLRRDVTNYDKALLDALSGLMFKDDSQITLFMAVKRLENMHLEQTKVFVYDEENFHEYFQKVHSVGIDCIGVQRL